MHGRAVDAEGNGLALIHQRLGEMAEARGDRAGAREHYSAFVELWTTADAELQPAVAGIRERLAGLQGDV